MTKETATFVLQRGDYTSVPNGCIGSELSTKIQNRDIFAVQRASEDTVKKWEYRYGKQYVTKTWESTPLSELATDLGMTANPIGNGSYELDMFIGDADTLYLIYYQYLLKSTDGVTWEIVNSALPFHAKGHEIAYKEEYQTHCSYHDGNMFVSAMNMVYKSSDNGVTWKLVLDKYVDYTKKRYNLVQKAYDKASGTTILFFNSGKVDNSKAFFEYSIDAGETWKSYRPQLGRGTYTQWSDHLQTFVFLSNWQDPIGAQLYTIDYAAVAANNTGALNYVMDVYHDPSFVLDTFIITPELMILSGNVGGGTVYVLDKDFNILRAGEDHERCSAFQSSHSTHVRYDERCQDILYGEYAMSGNSTNTPKAGRYNLHNLNAGNDWCVAGEGDFFLREAACMVYHPPTKKYYQVSNDNIEYSFEQEPGDVDFKSSSEEIIADNLDEINDTDLFCCTDTDGVTYKVSGKQFKCLVSPDDDLGEVDWVKINPTAYKNIFVYLDKLLAVKPADETVYEIDSDGNESVFSQFNIPAGYYVNSIAAYKADGTKLGLNLSKTNYGYGMWYSTSYNSGASWSTAKELDARAYGWEIACWGNNAVLMPVPNGGGGRWTTNTGSSWTQWQHSVQAFDQDPIKGHLVFLAGNLVQVAPECNATKEFYLLGQSQSDFQKGVSIVNDEVLQVGTTKRTISNGNWFDPSSTNVVEDKDFTVYEYCNPKPPANKDGSGVFVVDENTVFSDFGQGASAYTCGVYEDDDTIKGYTLMLESSVPVKAIKKVAGTTYCLTGEGIYKIIKP